MGEWARGPLDDAEGLWPAPGIRRPSLRRGSPGYALEAPELGVSSASKSRGGHTVSLWTLVLPVTVWGGPSPDSFASHRLSRISQLDFT